MNQRLAMQTDKTKVLVAVLGIMAALAWIYFATTPSEPKKNRRAHETFGQIVALEAAKLLGSNGGVRVISRDTAVFENPVNDFQLAGLCKALQEAKIPIAATNLLKQDPWQPLRVPAEEFVKCLQKAQAGDVIVSLLGPPVLGEKEKALVAEKKPKIVAVCSGGVPHQVDLHELFAQGLLHAAVLNRPNPGAYASRADDPRHWFDRYYQVVTPTNLSELPVFPKSSTP